jgi:hypothetical protein
VSVKPERQKTSKAVPTEAAVPGNCRINTPLPFIVDREQIARVRRHANHATVGTAVDPHAIRRHAIDRIDEGSLDVDAVRPATMARSKSIHGVRSAKRGVHLELGRVVHVLLFEYLLAHRAYLPRVDKEGLTGHALRGVLGAFPACDHGPEPEAGGQHETHGRDVPHEQVFDVAGDARRILRQVLRGVGCRRDAVVQDKHSLGGARRRSDEMRPRNKREGAMEDGQGAVGLKAGQFPSRRIELPAEAADVEPRTD